MPLAHSFDPTLQNNCQFLRFNSTFSRAACMNRSNRTGLGSNRPGFEVDVAIPPQARVNVLKK